MQQQSCFSLFFYLSVGAGHTTDEWKLWEKGEKLGTRFSFQSSSLLRKIEQSGYLTNVWEENNNHNRRRRFRIDPCSNNIFWHEISFLILLNWKFSLSYFIFSKNWISIKYIKLNYNLFLPPLFPTLKERIIHLFIVYLPEIPKF